MISGGGWCEATRQMWPFSSTYDVPDQTIDWLNDSFDWAIANGLLTRTTPLIQLSSTFFKAPSSKHPDFAKLLLEDIKRLLGLETSDIDIQPIDQIDGKFRHEYQTLVSIGGTWQSDGNTALIRYNPEMITRPVVLIATLAHECMHHVLRGLPGLAPGGEETEELSTDLHCISMGFGVFQLAAAENIGWHGYLRQSTRAHALAMFLRVRSINENEALRVLPPRAQSQLRSALKWLDRNDPSIAGRLI